MAPLLPCPPANSSHPPPPPPSSPTRPQPSKALSAADLEAAGQLLLPLPPEVTVAYNKDPSPLKVNLGVGAYRTEEGKPLVLNVVRRAKQMLINNPSRVKEYLPITGLAEFNKLSAKLIFGTDRYFKVG